jgi:hypothetical protein
MPFAFSASDFLLWHDTVSSHWTLPHLALVAAIILFMIVVLLCGVLLASKLVEATTFPSDGFGDVISISRHHQRHVLRRQQQQQQQLSSGSLLASSLQAATRGLWVPSASNRHHPTAVLHNSTLSGAAMGSRHDLSSGSGHIRVHIS